MLRSVSALGEPSPAILVGLDDLNRSAGLALMRQPTACGGRTPKAGKAESRGVGR